MIKRGLIYGFTGLIMEIIWTGLCALMSGDASMGAHTSLIMLPIYGMAVLLEPMFYGFRLWQVPLTVRGVAYALMIFAGEYVWGCILRYWGVCPWYYRGPFSVQGLIRLDYLPLWAVAGLFFEGLYMKGIGRREAV